VNHVRRHAADGHQPTTEGSRASSAGRPKATKEARMDVEVIFWIIAAIMVLAVLLRSLAVCRK